MVDKDEELFSKVLARIDEIAFWLGFQGRPKLRQLLLTELNTDAKRKVYQMTNGEYSRREIASKTNVSDDNVQS